MGDSCRKQEPGNIVQELLVTAIELADGEEGICQRDILKEVALAPDCYLQGIIEWLKGSYARGLVLLGLS